MVQNNQGRSAETWQVIAGLHLLASRLSDALAANRLPDDPDTLALATRLGDWWEARQTPPTNPQDER